MITQDKVSAVRNWVTDEALRLCKYEPFADETYRFLVDKISGKLAMGSHILDIGCGTGAFAKRLAGAGFRVTGIDLSDDMLKLARDNCRDLGNVSFRKADAEDLPFDHAAFDAVLCFAVHHHFLAYHRIVAEVSRVLKPGGRLFIGDPNGINPHIALLMHPRSPVRYSKLASNQKPIRPQVLQKEYRRYGISLDADFLDLRVQPRPSLRKSGFWFRPAVYKYFGFVINSIKEPWRYIPAVLLFNIVHLIMRFMPERYRSNYVFLTGQKRAAGYDNKEEAA